MSIPEIITFDELTDEIELETTDNEFIICAEFLRSAINDWPTFNLQKPKDLLDELKNEINKLLTFDNLNTYSKDLRINVS